MKTLITVNNIKELAGSGKKVLYLEPGAIITPAARDAAKEMGVVINFGPEPQPAACPEPVRETQPETASQAICPDLIARIVKEVLARLPQHLPGEMIKEEDPSGLRLVRGSSVKCQGAGKVVTVQESADMCAGFLTLEGTSCCRNLSHEEVDYVLEGTLEVTVNGRTFKGRGGDVFYLPAGSSITFSSPDQVRVFFVTHPANRSSLSC